MVYVFQTVLVRSAALEFNSALLGFTLSALSVFLFHVSPRFEVPSASAFIHLPWIRTSILRLRLDALWIGSCTTIKSTNHANQPRPTIYLRFFIKILPC